MIVSAVFVLASALVGIASAANIDVQVGYQNGLVFNPTNVQAQLNDVVSFQFVSKNHTVTQSTFPDPCNPMPGGVDSGYQPVANGSDTIPSWSITINDPSKALWFYCKQTVPVNHCSKGMVFAINDNAEKSFAAFQATAMGSTANGTTTTAPPPPATGGGPSAGAGAGAGSPPGGVVPGGTATDSGAASGSTSASAPNGAIASRSLNSAGAVSMVSLIAAVAGFML